MSAADKFEEQQIAGALARAAAEAERRTTPSASARSASSRESAAAARRLTARVAAQGLADISYAPVQSPFGTLLAASTAGGLVRLAFPEESVDGVLERLAARISPRIVEAPAPLEGALTRAPGG